MSPADRLAAYRDKRDFTRTAEPTGAGKVKPQNRFVVQLHAARRRHFDVRLEYRGVLLSWAVPEGPSTDPKVKRLAVRTEDHPLEYADFEGIIPEGAYGGGAMIVWDRGRFAWLEPADEGLDRGSLKIRFAGERLRGDWKLVRMKPRAGERQEAWLLIKSADAFAGEALPLDGASIVSNRTIKDLSRSAEPPPYEPPALATLSDRPPTGPGWLHEVKFDGYRILAGVAMESVRLYTRSGHDWTDRFPEIARALAGLRLDRALLDGEIAAADADGRTDFGALQKALSEGRTAGLSYFVFDLLSEGGQTMKAKPLRERQERLGSLLAGAVGPIHPSLPIPGDGAAVFAACCARGLEGVVSKRADARYVNGRSKAWIKAKCLRRERLVVGGWTPSTARPFAALLLGRREGDALVYAGRVGTGFDAAAAKALETRMAALSATASPFKGGAPPKAARWVRPEIEVDVQYADVTDDGLLRHASLLAIAPAAPSRPSVRITHPDKVLVPEIGLTKQALAAYYARVAERMAPYAFGRPVSLVRCPEGRLSGCFFQKHAVAGTPPEIETVETPSSEAGTKRTLTLPNAAALEACAQIGALEIHLWGARNDAPEKPDRLVFDLDPDEGLAFTPVREAALDLRDLLTHAGLPSFALLTGGKGVHLVTPLRRRHDWARVTAFARGVAERLERLAPDRFVAGMAKARRKGRIFVDHFRNRRGATAVAPYSPRARAHAPLAWPVTWETLRRCERADIVTIADAARRISEPDPWADYSATPATLTRSAFARLGLAPP